MKIMEVIQPPPQEPTETDPFRVFAAQIKSQYGLHSFDVWQAKNGDIKLNMLVVPRKQQKHGLGTAAMTALCRFADQHQRRIILTPASKDDNFGTTSRARLVAFYKRFGFVDNKGRKKDFELNDGMYRNPR